MCASQASAMYVFSSQGAGLSPRAFGAGRDAHNPVNVDLFTLNRILCYETYKCYNISQRLFTYKPAFLCDSKCGSVYIKSDVHLKDIEIYGPDVALC